MITASVRGEDYKGHSSRIATAERHNMTQQIPIIALIGASLKNKFEAVIDRK